MIKRAVSTALLWGIVLGAIGFGGFPGGVGLLLVASLLGQREFISMARRKLARSPLYWLPLLATAGIIAATYFGALQGFFIAIASGLAVLGLADTLRHGVAWQAFPATKSLFFVTIPMVFLLLLAQISGSLELAIWVVAVAKFNDAGALIVGTLIGRTKLAPELSPRKTLEGALGGISVGTLVGWLAAEHLISLPDGLTVTEATLIAVLLGPLAIVGDLGESWLKRRAGIKDSGAHIPGIGGVLDLLDSLILCAPTAYLIVKLAA